MKKLLAVFLALMMVLSVSLMACKKDEEPNLDDDVEDDDFIVNKNNKKDTTDTGNENDDDDNGADTSNGGNVSSAWVDKTGTVYVCANQTRVRKAPDKTSVVQGKLNIGDAVNYTATNGLYYKFDYNGQVGYISAEFTDSVKSNTAFSAPTTPAVNTAIHVKSDVISLTLRTDPCMVDSADIIKAYINSTCTANGEMTILEISDSGVWAKVKFKGKDNSGNDIDGTFYCGASFIVELAGTDDGGHG